MSFSLNHQNTKSSGIEKEQQNIPDKIRNAMNPFISISLDHTNLYWFAWVVIFMKQILSVMTS